MLLNKNRFWFACYDDGDDDLGTTGTTGATGTDEVVKDQAQLNAVLKREKEKFRKEREKLAQQLEQHKNTSRLSTEEKTALETQIEELRTTNLTVEERARHQLTKAQKDAKDALDAETGKAKKWETQYHDLKIGHDIVSAASLHEVLPGSMDLVEAYLRPKTRLVPDVDDEGKETGTHTAKVKFQDVDKAGKAVVLDLTVEDTVKRMKELPDKFGSLFKGSANGGVGGNTGAPGKKPNVANMSTAEYMAQRKKDPASLGLT